MMRLAASLTETRQPRDPGDLPSFPEFSRQIRAEMRQSGLLEGILFDRITASAWRLARLDPAAIPVTRDEQRAERSLLRALEMLESLRASCEGSSRQRSVPTPPPLPARPAFHTVPEPVADDDGGLCDSWRDRLTFDPKTSDASPIVKGTWITVDHLADHRQLVLGRHPAHPSRAVRGRHPRLPDLLHRAGPGRHLLTADSAARTMDATPR